MNKLIIVLILSIILVVGLIFNKKNSEKFQANNQYYLSQNLKGCPNTNRIKTKQQCEEASNQLASRGFNKEVNGANRTPGCFLDPNGFGYFNNRDLNNSTDDGLWGNGICVSSGSRAPSPPASSSGNQVIENAPGVGGWGGSCTCPDGQVYQVGDENNYCASLACEGGVSGTCNRSNGEWSRRRVVCAPASAPAPAPAPAPATATANAPGPASAPGPAPGVTYQVQGCNFDSTTPHNSDNCNECISNMNCPMSQCSSVCGLSGCNQPSNVNNNTCRKYGIIDLYRPIFNRFNTMVASLENPDVVPVDANFDELAQADVNERELGSRLWSSIKNLYEVSSLHTRSNFVDKKNLEKVLNQQKEKLDSDSVAISDLSELNSTSKRHIEINMNKYRKMEYQMSVLKYILFAVMALLIIPILTFMKVFDKKLGMGILAFLLVIIAIASYFFLYVKNVGRDNNDFKEFNFAKPTDEQVARSKMLSEMSNRDKARCQALAELEDDFDPASLNIDISQYRSQDNNQSNQCASIRTNDYS